jgi:hypothetical protein
MLSVLHSCMSYLDIPSNVRHITSIKSDKLKTDLDRAIYALAEAARNTRRMVGGNMESAIDQYLGLLLLLTKQLILQDATGENAGAYTKTLAKSLAWSDKLAYTLKYNKAPELLVKSVDSVIDALETLAAGNNPEPTPPSPRIINAMIKCAQYSHLDMGKMPDAKPKQPSKRVDQKALVGAANFINNIDANLSDTVSTLEMLLDERKRVIQLNKSPRLSEKTKANNLQRVNERLKRQVNALYTLPERASHALGILLEARELSVPLPFSGSPEQVELQTMDLEDSGKALMARFKHVFEEFKGVITEFKGDSDIQTGTVHVKDTVNEIERLQEDPADPEPTTDKPATTPVVSELNIQKSLDYVDFVEEYVSRVDPNKSGKIINYKQIIAIIEQLDVSLLIIQKAIDSNELPRGMHPVAAEALDDGIRLMADLQNIYKERYQHSVPTKLTNWS